MAALLVDHGKPIVIDEVELPDPAPHQVIVRQFATGVCHSQLHQIQNPAFATPLVMGHESTGVVLAAGRDVTHVREGDHVFLTWVPRDARPDSRVYEPVSVRYRGQDIRASGFTWAQTTIANEHLVVKLDRDAPTDITAIIGCAVMTGCGAVINTAEVQKGQSVAVFGAGGVGVCIIQAAKNAGAGPIIAVDVAEEKLEFAAKFGASLGINAARQDPVARIVELTGGGVDFAFDAIGLPITMQQLLPSVKAGVTGLRDGGTAVLVGAPQETATLNMRDLFWGRHYRGCIGGSSRPEHDFPIYLQWFASGRLPLDLLVTRRYKLSEINEACSALEAGQIAGRAIVEL